MNRYTQEFERLLAKVGQNDRDGDAVARRPAFRRGQGYTMLAHASGRSVRHGARTHLFRFAEEKSLPPQAEPEITRSAG